MHLIFFFIIGILHSNTLNGSLIGKYISFSGHCIVCTHWDKINILDPTVFMLGNEMYTEWVNERADGWTHAHIHQAPALFALPALSSLQHLSMENICTEYSTQWTAHCIRLGDLLCLANFACFKINKTRIHTQQRNLNLKKERKKTMNNEMYLSRKKNMEKILFHSLFLLGFVFGRALISHEAPWYHIISQEFALEFTFFFRLKMHLFSCCLYLFGKQKTTQKWRMKIRWMILASVMQCNNNSKQR